MARHMNNVDTRFLPPCKANFIRKQYANIPDAKALKIETYSDVRIVPLGYVEDACNHSIPNRLVEDLDLCADIKKASSDSIIENCTVLYCGYIHPKAWGHFITNSLARIWPICEIRNKIDRYVFLTNDFIDLKDIRGNFAEIFKLLGIIGKIEILKEPKAYKTLIVGDLSYQLDYKAYPEYVRLIEFIRNEALRDMQIPEIVKPMFFSRSALKKADKKDIGIEIIDKFYEENGFEIVHPEKLTLTEMIRKLYITPIAVFISGSVAHNSIFSPCNKETHIIERSAICNIFQPVIEAAFSHKVTYIQASISLLPVAYGNGPFLYSLTIWMQKYAEMHNYNIPEISNHTTIKNFKTYLNQREKLYRYRWWVDDWASNQLPIFLEAYEEAKNTYSRCIGGSNMIYVSPLKRFVKKILGRN